MKTPEKKKSAATKVKKLIIVGMLVCYMPFSSGCAATTVMAVLQVVSMVSGMIASNRRASDNEAMRRGENPNTSATTTWSNISTLASIGTILTGLGSNLGLFDSSSSSGSSSSGAWTNPDDGQVWTNGRPSGSHSGNSQTQPVATNQNGTDVNTGTNFSGGNTGSGIETGGYADNDAINAADNDAIARGDTSWSQGSGSTINTGGYADNDAINAANNDAIASGTNSQTNSVTQLRTAEQNTNAIDQTNTTNMSFEEAVAAEQNSGSTRLTQSSEPISCIDGTDPGISGTNTGGGGGW